MSLADCWCVSDHLTVKAGPLSILKLQSQHVISIPVEQLHA